MKPETTNPSEANLPGREDFRSLWRPVSVVGLVALVWHGLWATTVPVPVDWDPAYYLDVARNIAAGRGAVTGVVWHLSALPETLPSPADLHWMPVPSRVLVPFVYLGDAVGAAVASVLWMVGWVPVTAGLARALGASRTGVVGAAVLAAMAGGYVRFGSTPDSIAVFGLVAGLAWLSAVRGQLGATVLWVCLAAWTRGDGFLLAPAVGLVFLGTGRHRSGVVVAAVGPLAFGAWMLRSWWVGGEVWWTARTAASRVVHIHDLQLGHGTVATVWDRLMAAGGGLVDGASVAVVVGVGVLPPLAFVGAWMRRGHPMVWGAVLYALGGVSITHFLAPGVAASGSAFRSGAAVFPVACALAAIATLKLGALGQAWRGYSRWLLPGIVGVGFGIGSGAMGLGTWAARATPGVPCPPGSADSDTPVFTGRPLLTRSTCGRDAVALYRGESAASVAERALRYGIREAWLPERDPDPLVPGWKDVDELLPGWQEQAPGVWLRPETPSATVGQ